VVALLGIGGGTTQTARELLDWSFANLDAMTPIAELPAVDARTSVTAEPAASNADPSDLAPTPAQVQAVNAADTQGVYDQAMAVDSPTGTAFAATAIVGGYESSPFVAAEQPPVQPAAERGFFASVLVGLFKAFMWLLLFLGIAVVLLRIRAVRRINRRRAERAIRQAATGSGEAATTRNRIPSRTR
jgi:hypothetical protein